MESDYLSLSMLLIMRATVVFLVLIQVSIFFPKVEELFSQPNP